MDETEILQLIRLKASQMGVVLSRNNCGKFQDRNGRWVSFGVFSPGGSDLLGFRPIIVTSEMIGQRIAQFVAIEVKQPGKKPTPEQAHFIETVQKAGGLAGILTDPEQVKIFLK